jgi:MoxR-like ATPase
MNNQRIVKLIQTYLTHMDQYAAGEVSKGNMLVSPPGVGKTQFVNMLAELVGISLITIEAPHIVEEKIINIPFLIKKPNASTAQRGSTEVEVTPHGDGDNENFDIELADSHLFTQLQAAQPSTDQQYIHQVYSNNTVRSFYESLGGTQQKIPPVIQDLRKHYRVILFIDEFFRASSPAISAILRSLLNKRIGMHHLPEDTYVTYASNKQDVGGSISDRQQNQRFNMYEMKSPNKEEWFEWLIGKFKDDYHGVTLNMKVIEDLKKVLKDEDISSDQETGEGDLIRMSPRRWEQLILYVNAAFPLKDKEDAMALLTNVRQNFAHYTEKETHKVGTKVLKAVSKLIKDIAGIDIAPTDLYSDTEWRNVLKHQIEMKKRLGDARKYVPVISGPPGIGKTANAASIAEEMNLRLVPIDASELVDAGEVIGLPAPNKANGKMSVKFVASKLFKQVYNIMAYEDNKYHASLIQEHGQADGERLYKEYEGQRWKYLIFFDEFNRAPAPVMNALRRIVLEKNFGEKDENGQMMKLPKEAIVMAAINPTGEGTHELTHHMRDVMDILPGSPSWTKQKAFLEKKPVRGATPEVKDAVINAIEHIAAKHGVKSKGAEVQPFYLDVGDNDGVYVTPNDMSDMYSMAARKVQDVVNQAIGDGQVTDLPPEEIKQLDHDIKDAIYEAFEPSLRDVFDNHQLDASKWLDVFHKWILGSTIGRDLTSTASEHVKKQESIGSILEKQLTTESSKPLMNNSSFVNYVKSNDHVSVTHEVDQWLRDLFSDNKKAKKYLTANGVNALKYDKESEEFHKTDEKVPAIFNLLAEVVVALHANGFSGEVYTNMVEAIETIVDDTLHRLAKEQEITKDEYRKLHIEHADMLGELLEI